MNKYLMLSAAAVLSSITTVQADTYCFGFNTGGGGSYCDSGRVSTGVDGGGFSGSVRAWQHLNNDCNGGRSEGYGVLGKTPGLGKVSVMSDNIVVQNSNISLAFQLPKKIKSGNEYVVWIGFSGTTFFQANSGALTGVSKCQNSRAIHGGKSVLSAVTEILREHRNAKMLSGGTR